MLVYLLFQSKPNPHFLIPLIHIWGHLVFKHLMLDAASWNAILLLSIVFYQSSYSALTYLPQSPEVHQDQDASSIFLLFAQISSSSSRSLSSGVNGLSSLVSVFFFVIITFLWFWCTTSMFFYYPFNRRLELNSSRAWDTVLDFPLLWRFWSFVHASCLRCSVRFMFLTNFLLLPWFCAFVCLSPSKNSLSFSV